MSACEGVWSVWEGCGRARECDCVGGCGRVVVHVCCARAWSVAAHPGHAPSFLSKTEASSFWSSCPRRHPPPGGLSGQPIQHLSFLSLSSCLGRTLSNHTFRYPLLGCSGWLVHSAIHIRAGPSQLLPHSLSDRPLSSYAWLYQASRVTSLLRPFLYLC